MKLFRPALLLLPLLLTACGLTDQQKADYAQVQRSGVSSAVYDKMVHQDTLGLYDIKALSRAGVSDGITLRYLRDQHSVYYLTSEDVGGLRKAGVSSSVVDYMLETPRMYTNYYPAAGLGFGYFPDYDPFWGPPYPFYPYPYHHHWH
jgi:hypothetical protein